MRKKVFAATIAVALIGNVYAAQHIEPTYEETTEVKSARLKVALSDVSNSPLLTNDMRELFAQFPQDKITSLMNMYKRSLVRVAVSLTEAEQANIVKKAKEKAKYFFATALLEDESDLGKQLYAQAEKAIDEGHYTFYDIPAEAFYNSHTGIKNDSSSEAEIFCGYYNADSLLCTIAHEVGHVLDDYYQKQIAGVATDSSSEHVSMFFENLFYSSEYGKTLLSSDYSFKDQRLMQLLLECLLCDFGIKFWNREWQNDLKHRSNTGRIDCAAVRYSPTVLEYGGTPEGDRNGVIDRLGMRDAVLFTMTYNCYVDRPNKILRSASGELTAEELAILNQAIETQKNSDVIKRLKQIRENNASLVDCELDWDHLQLKVNYSSFYIANMDADRVEIDSTFSTISRNDDLEPEIATVSIDDIISKKSEFFRRRELDEHTIKTFLGELIFIFKDANSEESPKLHSFLTPHLEGYYHAWCVMTDTISRERINSGEAINVSRVMELLTKNTIAPTKERVKQFYKYTQQK